MIDLMIDKCLKGEFREVAMALTGMNQKGKQEFWTAFKTTKGLGEYEDRMLTITCETYEKELQEVGKKSILGKRVIRFYQEQGKMIIITDDNAEYCFYALNDSEFDSKVDFRFVDRPTPNVTSLSILVARKNNAAGS